MSTQHIYKHCITLVSLLFIIGCTTKNNLLTVRGFTGKYLDSLEKRLPSQKFIILDDSTIISKFQGNDFTISVDNAYKEYLLTPDSLSKILTKYVLATSELYNPWDKPTIDQIVPMIKPVAFLEDLQLMAAKMGATKGVEAIYEKYNDQLIIAYAVDSKNSIGYLTQDEMNALSVSKDSLRVIAMRNLDRLLHIELKGGDGVYMLTAGGNYEVSLILFKDIFTKENIKVNGDFIIAIPNRDLLLITGSNDKKGIDKLKETIRKAYSEGDHQVSEYLYKWNGKIFQKYE